MDGVDAFIMELRPIEDNPQEWKTDSLCPVPQCNLKEN